MPEASTDQFGSLSCEEKRYQKSRGPRTVNGPAADRPFAFPTA